MTARHGSKTSTALVLLAPLTLASSSIAFAHGQALAKALDVGGTSYGIAYDSGNGEVFVTHFFNDTVTVVSDANDAVVATIGLGVNYEPVGVAYDSGNGELFVAKYGANTVSVISDATDSVVARVAVGNFPGASPMTPARERSSWPIMGQIRSRSYRSLTALLCLL